MAKVNKIEGQEGTITVSRTKFNQTDEEQSLIEIRPFATTPAKVAVKLGRTINLGNYESARIDVSFEMPCYAEEAKDIYKGLMAETAKILQEEVEKVTGPMNVEQSVEDLI